MFSRKIIDGSKLVDRSNTRGESQDMIYKIDDDYLRAGNPDTGGRELHELSKSENEKIRRRVAENPNSCLATLYRLLFDTNAEVRLALSTNEYVPDFFIEQLVKDQDEDVRFGLAENSKLPLKLLGQLENDSNPYVASRARKTLKSLCCQSRVCAA